MPDLHPGPAPEGVATRPATEARPASAPAPRRRGAPSVPPALRRGALVQALAALLWLPQAGLLAFAVQGIAAGEGVQATLWPAALVLLLGLARAGLEAWGGRRVFAAARALLSGLRAGALTALATRSPLDATRPASGAAASLLVEQADAVLPYLLRFRPARLRAALVPPAILLAVLPFSWSAALALLLAAPLIPLFMALIGWRAQAASEAQMLELGGMNSFLLDRLRGLASIRALGASAATAERLRLQAESLRARTMAVLRIAFLSSTVLELFSALGVALVAVSIGFHLLGEIRFGSWGRQLSLGEGLFILLLAPAFFEPLREMCAAWHDRAAGEAALAALRALAAPAPRLPGALDGAPAPASTRPPGLSVRGLRFRHAGAAAPALEDVSLEIRPGEHVALLGPSGAGKSSLLALLAGLAVPEAGQIRLDGRPMDEENAALLRRRIAWVGQAPHLFAGSLRANVALGRPGVTAEATARALRLAGLAGWDPARPVGEGGHGLSGGEALRLALARAVADPAATLVLADEPTAHLDAATAAAVTETLLGLCQGRTLLLATHDPALAARMDRVITL
ncbi:thiol reductant ABC exporter subunit CydD [Roseomonas sp. GC11]|uniref:thiol reductant ABC exporter subunit CydD n=1 Tax=Roseomonas sp. GC11 TaxID=2950546 RepID=UPI00210C4AD8|nr:thiol reductant ABC exporter subunit CydD [Roseomonas sp. GC11]MCQ4162487.1 thiol reductant ABC exporter subunit CydD [Roseomonas sp. GC11]